MASHKTNPENPFKSSINTWYTKELFVEFNVIPENCRFTLQDHDYRGYPSLHRLYLEANDPTEYRVAVDHLGGLQHWQTLCRAPFFRPYIEDWRYELELKLRSEGLSKIIETSRGTTKDAFSANRYLIEKGWVPKDGPSKGRPSKDSIRQAATEIAEIDKRLEEDLKRIHLDG